ncbi:hypothetical protein MMC30_008717 [Trapelia coarctata]|nr:hypothetical protein [Trapelia coarctata]
MANVNSDGLQEEPVAPSAHESSSSTTQPAEKTGRTDEEAPKPDNPGSDGNHEDGNHEKKGPAGGFDATPVPKLEPGYTVKFTFHGAKNLPPADLNTLSSDPYLVANLESDIPSRHKEDPDLRWRTPTQRRSLHPEWNSDWIVANVPPKGIRLRCTIYDEDPGNHDDRVGDLHIDIKQLSEDWEGIKEQPYDIRKRKGSKRAYLLRGCMGLFSRSIRASGGQTIISVQVLERSPPEHAGRMYTVGPCVWSQHFSPMIGRLAGTKEAKEDSNGNTEKKTESYNFQANQVQLAGPVPEEMYHRYVEFKPVIAGMFTAKSLRGRILNRALHHQHYRIYNYDRSTIYGLFPKPSKTMTLQFLDLVHFDRGGRIFTYVLSLDGQWRFTETGKEFGIDLLSKHTMHSNVSIYVAFSGEFFIRRLKDPWKDPEHQETHPPVEIDGGPPNQESPKDPAHYQLIIDNDSGTYRPNADLLPQLKKFFNRNLPGLKITTLDCNKDKEKMEKYKKEQSERRKAEGKNVAILQGDAGSISSSDEEDLDALAGQPKERGKIGKVAHGVAEPKEKVMEWAGGTKRREKREEEDDQGAARGEGGVDEGGPNPAS